MNDIDQRIIFSKNLNYYLSLNNKTQKEVADAIAVSPQTFNTWCQGIALPRMGKVQRLADYFGIGKSDLIDERNQEETTIDKPRSKGVVIKVLGHVAAGIPIEAIEDVIDMEEIPEEMARTGEFFGLRIKGDSMEPDIHNGDTVIVRKQEDADSDDIVIAIVNGYDGVCKRLKKYAESIALVSINAAYEPMYFSAGEIDEIPVRIVGKVMELRRKF